MIEERNIPTYVETHFCYVVIEKSSKHISYSTASLTQKFEYNTNVFDSSELWTCKHTEKNSKILIKFFKNKKKLFQKSYKKIKKSVLRIDIKKILQFLDFFENIYIMILWCMNETLCRAFQKKYMYSLHKIHWKNEKSIYSVQSIYKKHTSRECMFFLMN